MTIQRTEVRGNAGAHADFRGNEPGVRLTAEELADANRKFEIARWVLALLATISLNAIYECASKDLSSLKNPFAIPCTSWVNAGMPETIARVTCVGVNVTFQVLCYKTYAEVDKVFHRINNQS